MFIWKSDTGQSRCSDATQREQAVLRRRDLFSASRREPLLCLPASLHSEAKVEQSRFGAHQLCDTQLTAVF